MPHIRLVLVAESVPLLDLVFICIKFRREREGYAIYRQIRAALLEVRPDSLDQCFSIEFESSGEGVQIMEVLHAAVRNA